MRVLRFYKIVSVLLRLGIDEMIPKDKCPWWAKVLRVSLFWLRNQHKDKPMGERLRMALETLGPVFIKFGQMLSTRHDLLPPDMVAELSKLQDKVAPFPGEQAQAVIEQSLGFQLNTVFESFEQTPLASASIAQVHAAELKDRKTGALKQVVIKVIRPDILSTINADLNLMDSLAVVAAKLLPDGRRLKPVEVIKEYRKTLLDELNLAREAANAIQLRRNFDDSELLYIPEVFSDFSRPNVMVMERIYGIPISDVAALEKAGINLKVLAERGVEVFFTQVFRDSFFHADMHPGNIFVDPNRTESPRYLAVDFGIVGTLNREDKRYLAENFIAFFNRDYRRVAELHIDSGWVPAHVNVEEFESAIRTVCEPIFEKPLAEISFAHVLLNLFNTARRFEMEVQPQLVLLQKTLLYVEGLGRNLYPQLDLWQTAKPFLERWMKERMGWPAMWRSLKEQAPRMAEKLPEMPMLLYDTLAGLKQQQRSEQVYREEQRQLQQQQAAGRWWSSLATSLTVASAVFIGFEHEGWLIASSLFVALFAWWQAWQKRINRKVK
ncbi:ubiquinone biosynthesis regulatory protein kinase UbiB [Aliidiomarina taiwanensis]|uniref:Probable protein kinase UbiB n=1 Tax=Aliidiomarina taiwanensis TaxID=946228 RepID=A0A432X0Z2_9GAMM|nr:ubiquinone biosynthesis regulatory protein kinase UbiB [Aliidiomarina taiwanensis]RUO39808.1 ubiquinone biosynthesis regulatory protein kinase UbiB [Aliidiomarina taiwanensis]